MPLVFAVLVIVWLFVVFKDKDTEASRKNAEYELSRRKTNAEKERLILDRCMKQGMTFSEAYAAAQAEMIKLGYDPCIPAKAYGTDYYGVKKIYSGEETSYISAVSERFDSDAVKTRKEMLNDSGLQATDDMVYSNFPTTHYEYECDIDRRILQLKSIEVGKWFTYPGYGTLEVVGYEYSPFNPGKGYYKAKVIKTGEIVTTIKIGDKGIREIK